MKFLSAKWHNLILVNYSINPSLLKTYLPKHTELDFFNNECYISLIGFVFKDTKVLGIKFPYHVNFEEVNLRFYVKHNNKRGVVFIKEIVPKPLITTIANSLYKEHYETCKMKSDFQKSNTHSTQSYSWEVNNQWQSMHVEFDNTPEDIKENSLEEFITEHYYGYTKNGNTTFEYEVQHPRWQHHQIKSHNLNVDFGLTYGKDFEFLTHQKPISIIFTEGSQVNVMNKKNITSS